MASAKKKTAARSKARSKAGARKPSAATQARSGAVQASVAQKAPASSSRSRRPATALRPTDAEIRRLAWDLWERGGRQEGRAHEDWAAAERQLLDARGTR